MFRVSYLALFYHCRLFMEVFFRFWIPSLVHISTSAWASTENLSQSFFDSFSVSYTYSLASEVRALQPTNVRTAYWPRNGAPTRKEEWFLHSICTNKLRNCPASADQGCCSTDSQYSCHVHGKSWLCPPASPYPTFFASATPMFKTDCANW